MSRASSTAREAALATGETAESRQVADSRRKTCTRCGREGSKQFIDTDEGVICSNKYRCQERAFRLRWGTGDRYSGLRGHANARRGADR